MDVRAVLVMLAGLMLLLQASGQTVNVNLNIGGNTGGSGTADKSQNMVTALLLEQNQKMQDQIKELQEKVKNLTVDQCRTKTTCCNKTLGGCPSGYERFCEKPDMCYKFSNDTKSYAHAKSACQADGGHLAMPKDKATNKVLVKIKLKYAIDIDTWIGLKDKVTEETWEWPVQYNHLANCAALSAINKWFDMNCSRNLHYICEVRAP